MPKAYIHKTDRKNGKHKPAELPARFKVGFLTTLDGRTDLAKALRANYADIVADIGGQVEVGHVKAALIERFCWLEAILQTLEHEMAQGMIEMSFRAWRKGFRLTEVPLSMPWLAPLPQGTGEVAAQPNGQAQSQAAAAREEVT